MNIKESIQLINYAAEQAHCRYITSGIGLTMVYQEKAEEAADFIAANYPNSISGYPLIKAEIDATGKSPAEVVDTIISKKAEWIARAAKIEKIRFGAIAAFKMPNVNFDVELESAKLSLDKI